MSSKYVEYSKVDMDAKIEKFIDLVDWVFAKTYAKIAPHEYAVRGDSSVLENEFVYFVKFIRKHGYKETFWNNTYTYYDVGEYQYWTMENPIDETTIINRAIINNSTSTKQSSPTAAGQ